ncbi:MAG: inorganic phosphate transporter, partial [Nitrososphaerota archaeon]|nr:inorganic phosphate transporter [Nitrososphaerota archaeon]
ILVSILLAFVLGWNNSGLTTGNLTNLIRYNISLAVTLLGMLAGFLLEGSKMTQSIVGNLVTTHISSGDVLVGAATSLVLFFSLAIAKIPVSMSNCIVGSFVGVAISSNVSVSYTVLLRIVGSWLVAPFICAGVAIAFYEIGERAVKSTSLSTASWANRIVLLLAVFYVSYALGANNGGMIYSIIVQSSGMEFSTGLLYLIEISIYVAIVTGTALFGKSIAKVVGEKIVRLSSLKTVAALLSTAFVTWAFTQISVPISLTQVVIGGMVGAGSAKGPTVVNKSELFSMIWHWVLVTILCAILAYGVEYLYHSIM